MLLALVQQQVTTPDALTSWTNKLGKLRHSDAIRAALSGAGDGIQSVAELDLRRACRRAGIAEPVRQVPRHDSTGRRRFVDAQWVLADGRVLILEVDGAFHRDVEQWEDDIARQRALTEAGAVIVRCTARELRDDPDRVLRDLRRLGVPHIHERKRSS